MLVLAAANPRWRGISTPRAWSAEGAREAIGAILDHEDVVVVALKPKLRIDAEKEKAFENRLKLCELESKYQRKRMARTLLSRPWTKDENRGTHAAAGLGGNAARSGIEIAAQSYGCARKNQEAPKRRPETDAAALHRPTTERETARG